MKPYRPTMATAAFLACVVACAPAGAQLNFFFSVTNTVGNVGGTFTGELFGLTDNATSSATSVVIDSFPVGLNSLTPAPVTATLWNQQDQNSFTVTGGVITAGGFWAEQTVGSVSYGYQLYLDGDGGPYNFLNLDGTDSHYVWGSNGLASTNFTPAPSTPIGTPEPGASALLACMCLGGTAYLRRRHKRGQ